MAQIGVIKFTAPDEQTILDGIVSRWLRVTNQARNAGADMLVTSKRAGSDVRTTFVLKAGQSRDFDAVKVVIDGPTEGAFIQGSYEAL